MIGAEEAEVFAAERLRAVEGERLPFLRQRGKGVGEIRARAQDVGAPAEVLDIDAEVIEQADEELLELLVAIEELDGADQLGGALGLAGVQLEQAVVALGELARDLGVLLAGAGEELLELGRRRFLQQRGEVFLHELAQLRGAVGVLLKGIEPLVIPAREHFLGGAGRYGT